MIVKRLEKNGKIKAMYSSSTICGSVYDTATKELTVIFNNGGQYKYPNVEATDYMRLETADSNGGAFTKHIKNKYTNYEKLDKLSDTALAMIMKEVGELKTVEDNVSIEVKTKAMMDSLMIFLTAYVSTNSVDDVLFERLFKNMSEFNDLKNSSKSE